MNSALKRLIVFLLCSFAASYVFAVQDMGEKVIAARIGEKFVVTLGSNKTTGCQWQLSEPVDDKLLQLLGSKYIPEKKRPGAGGTEEWTFKAIGAGLTSISFKYIRPWQAGVPAAIAKYAVIIR